MYTFEQLSSIVAGSTWVTNDRLKAIFDIAGIVNKNNVVGDFVECGVCNGGTAAILASRLGSRHLWMYDSFEGLPEPVDVDGDEAMKWTGKAVGNENQVVELLDKVGVTGSQYTINKGWFCDTFKDPLPKAVAVLHCDADWYESTILTLETFYHLIPDGGCVILDDFGWWEGCRVAFYDFCFRHSIKPLLERCGDTQAFWFKGKTNNRVWDLECTI
jgi:O-methyltransferase